MSASPMDPPVDRNPRIPEGETEYAPDAEHMPERDPDAIRGRDQQSSTRSGVGRESLESDSEDTDGSAD